MPFQNTDQNADNVIIAHFGGNIMHHFKALGTISFLLGFTLLVCGCTANKSQANNADFGISAEAVPEGILIHLKNIPADASHMWIAISTVDDTEDPESPRSIISSYAALTNTNEMNWVGSSVQLEKVKQTGTILFPYAESGKNYHISADVYTLQEREQYMSGDESLDQHRANAEVTATGGIYFNRDDVRLELSNDNTALTLSSQPVFPPEVTFADQMYRFSFTIQVESGSLGVGDHHIPEGLSPDGLTWVFEPQMSTVNLRGNDWLEEGVNYPAWASAYVNILHEDIIWSINIANTPLSDFCL